MTLPLWVSPGALAVGLLGVFVWPAGLIIGLEQAPLVQAHAYNTFSSHFIRGLLDEAPPAEPTVETTPTLRPVPAIAVQGDLKPYQRLLTAGGIGHE